MGWVSNAKIFKGKYEAKLEFPDVQGLKQKITSVGGVWIFSGLNTMCYYVVLCGKVHVSIEVLTIIILFKSEWLNIH